ncbi:terpene synthase family protein [Streptomyces sp. NPDC001709]
MHDCVAWARKSGLGGGDPQLAELYGNAGALLTAHVFPRATGPLQQALADYGAWAFESNDRVVPDRKGHLGEVVHAINRWAQLMRAPGTWMTDAVPFEEALRDALERIRIHASDVQYERMVRGQETWLQYMLWETALRENNRPPGVNEYLAMRTGSGGTYATIGYLDLVQDIETTAPELAAPAVRAAAHAGILTAVLDNDRYSCFKEESLGQDKYTLTGALRTDDPALKRQESLRRTVQIRNTVMAMYLHLRDQVLTDASAQLHSYFEGIDRVIAGNFNFATTALRYLDPATAALCRHTTTAPPDLATDNPLPYPAISWWWDLLKAPHRHGGTGQRHPGGCGTCAPVRVL